MIEAGQTGVAAQKLLTAAAVDMKVAVPMACS